MSLKYRFMKLLEDEDVIKKLNKVLKLKNKTPDNLGVMSAEYQRLENENISLKSQLDKITEENDGLENTISEKQRDITNLKSYNHDILEKYNSNKKELDEIFGKYCFVEIEDHYSEWRSDTDTAQDLCIWSESRH